MAKGEIQSLSWRGRVTPLATIPAFCGLLLLVASAVACEHTSQKAEERASAVPWDPEEYAVYDTIIRQQYLGENIRLIVIEEDTGTAAADIPPPDTHSFLPEPPGELRSEENHQERAERLWVEGLLRPDIEGASTELLEDLTRKNRLAYSLSSRFRLDVPVVLIEKEESRALFSLRPGGKGWSGFAEKYPYSQGILRLSRVGFDQEMKQALVYVGNKDFGGGAGYYSLLSKHDGAWIIEHKKEAWVA